ncbi:hypothetical protein [Endozoicomonas euniceicola]|uniref:Uncharacterized protein n=1 Tax=Endozoicomonas euniceicola TaxID=1234143 RepID=A0ABY6GZV5_9GAMM|nr:hypothetical protein [Endozoicomonas euniceicola]UYM17576.1 hypothetical protein NX720_06600 [Endozoicomonas euniceicola]
MPPFIEKVTLNGKASVIHSSGIQVKDKQGRPRSVCFFNQAEPLDNRFHVVDQLPSPTSA